LIIEKVDLRVRRKVLGLTQKDVADLVGISRQQYHAWENHLYRPAKTEHVIRLAEVLNIKYEEAVLFFFQIEESEL
jgi:DNA-binding XRE family transcriptional regulator